MADSGTWRGCSTLTELFRASANDWGNNSYAGVRHRQHDGKLDAWLEWETYREVELSVTAIARSLRVVLGHYAAPGVTVAILGPPSTEALKIWQASMHLSAVPVFIPCEGSLSTTQLAKLLSALKITAAFANEDQQLLLCNAICAMKDSVTSPAAATAAAAVPQLVVVWGAGGIRYSKPQPDIAQRLTHAGVATIAGYESFKRSHFNDEPAAAFAEMFMPKASDVAAVVITATTSPTAGAVAYGAADSADAAGVESELASAGLRMESMSHAELLKGAAGMLRQRFPKLEATLQPYVAGETDGAEWAGRPHTTTTCITGSSLARTEKLTKLAAATAAAGRISFDVVDEDTTADGRQLLVDL